jgi:hypothetical protein
MPYSDKAKRFLGMCSNPKSRKKVRGKCPPQKTARRLLKHK